MVHYDLVTQKLGVQLLSGNHSWTLPGVVIRWVLKSIFFSLPLTIEIGADKSEFLLEPGIIMFLSFGMHLSKIELIRLFHSFDPLYTKLCLVISRLCLGTSKI